MSHCQVSVIGHFGSTMLTCEDALAQAEALTEPAGSTTALLIVHTAITMASHRV